MLTLNGEEREDAKRIYFSKLRQAEAVDLFTKAHDWNWRKRAGVEPTQDRLTALSGFEGQPPHRERFPSIDDDG